MIITGCLMPVQVSYAQSNYQDGLVVTHSGDTLRGQIDDREWIHNPDAIKFRRDASSNDRLFTPLDLKVFYVSGRWYKGTIIAVDDTPQEARLRRTEITPSTRMDTVFLSVLVKGPLSLYYYRDQREHFYLENSSDIIELISHEYIIRKEGEFYVIKADNYINQIKRHALGCPEIKAADLRYSKSSFMEFVTDCNSYVEPFVSQYVRKVERSAFGSGIFFGVSRTHFKVIFGETAVPFTPARNFTFGYSAVLTLPGARGRRSLFANLQFHTFESYNKENYSNQVASLFSNTVVEESVEAMVVNASYLKLGVGYEYEILAGTIRPFFDLGASVAKRLHHRTTGLFNIRLYNYEGGSMSAEENLELVDSYTGWGKILTPYNFMVGGFVGVGIKLGRVSIALRNELSFFSSNSTSLRTAYLTAGFSFGN